MEYDTELLDVTKDNYKDSLMQKMANGWEPIQIKIRKQKAMTPDELASAKAALEQARIQNPPIEANYKATDSMLM